MEQAVTVSHTMEQAVTSCSRKQDIPDLQEAHKDNVIQTSLQTVNCFELSI